MNKNLLAPYGLKFNPFWPDLPVEALRVTPRVESFLFRVEQVLVREGGFALVTGDPGCGKSVTLRLLAERLERAAEITVGALVRPQGNLADFYRQIGEIFGLALKPHNRWAGFKALRQRWQGHVEATLMRPVLLIDEAQEMSSVVLAELRLLGSTRFDSRQILSVILAGDGRLVDRFRHPDLLPLGSRIRTRLTLEYASPEELQACLKHLLAEAGNAALMTPELIVTLTEHAAGNYRVLTRMAAELLAAGAEKGRRQLDEKLYFEVFAVTKPAPARSGRRA